MRNRLASKTDALTQTETYQYDPAGALAFVTDRKGQVRGYTYDLLGRLTQAGFGAASTTSPVYDSTIAYTYDAGNRVTQIADSANGTISRQYDDRFDTVTQETTPQGSVAYTYDAAGRRATMTPSGATQLSYGFDAADRLTGITQGTSMVGLAYDAADRRTTLTLANGVTVSYGYDTANELTGLTYRDGSNNLLGDLSYGYDAAGRRISQGGSFARTGLPDPVNSATFDANNRASAWNGTALSYDANGNLLGFAGDSIAGTAATSSRASRAPTPPASSTTPWGGARRRRSQVLRPRSCTTARTRSRSSRAAPSRRTCSRALGSTKSSRERKGQAPATTLPDALGSTIRLTDSAATKLVDYTYEPYGKTSADAGSTNAFQYTGRENDGTGLYYYRARYMSPVMGRFVSEDPIGLAGGWNIYSYVAGNPISYKDPEGKELILAALGALVGGIANGVNSYSSGGSFAGGFAVGALAGGVAGLIGNPFTAGAVYGAISTFGNRTWLGVTNHCNPWIDYGIGIGLGSLGAGVGHAVGGAFGGASVRSVVVYQGQFIGQQLGMFNATVWGNNFVNYSNFYRSIPPRSSNCGCQ